MLTIGSLFSGIGGIELGLERTGGFKTIWNCEIDEYASAVLRKHWPDVPNLGDITKVEWETVQKPDVLCGGFPCQDISVAGKGAGIEKGKRSGLWREFARCIRALRPKYVVVENVPMLVKRGLHVVLADLAEAGYDAEWHNISASAVGAWHRRERIFILASRQIPYAISSGHNGRREEEPQYRTVRYCEVVPHTEAKYRVRAGRALLTERGAELSNTESAGQLRKKQLENDNQSQRGQSANDTHAESKIRGEISDTKSERVQGRWPVGEQIARIQAAERLLGCHRAANQRGIWAAEPELGRVANGVPNRVDRIKCLGNAVVPQVAQVIGEIILEYERGKCQMKPETEPCPTCGSKLESGICRSCGYGNDCPRGVCHG